MIFYREILIHIDLNKEKKRLKKNKKGFTEAEKETYLGFLETLEKEGLKSCLEESLNFSNTMQQFIGYDIKELLFDFSRGVIFSLESKYEKK